MRSETMRTLRPFFPLAAAAALALSCGEAMVPPPVEVTAVHRDVLPADPGDTAWVVAPVFTAKLLLQDVVEPRLLETSTPELRVQAVSDGERLALRLAWDDESQDDLPGAARFDDACAIQLPQNVAPDVPDPQMGETSKPVEVSYWRASWQAIVDGRGDTIQDLYPNAWVDHYPFEAAHLEPGSEEQRKMALRYAPARALGNDRAGPRERPVEDLIALGPGSLSRADSAQSDGSGRRSPDGWEVVITRPLPDRLESGGRSVVAFAVWNGARDEAGSRKMRSGWIPLAVE
jgi:DMSO reductase family type II enzyme heme b subunit